MKLSTKKIFTSSKKAKNPLNKKSKLCITKSVPMNKSNQSSTDKKENSNQKSNKKNNTASNKINPFNENFIKNNNPNNFLHKKIQSSKEQIHLKFLKNDNNNIRPNIKRENNAVNDFALNDEFTLEEKKQNKNQNEVDIETLVNLFKYKSSKLKSTIIMDDDGNNNLNSEQRKFIMDCFDKKTKMENNFKKCKIDLIKKKKSSKNRLKNLSINLKKNNYIRTDRSKRFNTRQPLFSSKLNYKFKELIKFEERKNDEDSLNFNKSNDDKENNSIFENCTDKSLDSSFLGSSLAEEEFIQ
jgi:hypothetical protein